MSAKIDQKAYLQKYLGGSSGDKKKKKKKVTKGSGFKIIDDDLDLTKLRPLDGDELDVFDEGEDAPQIAGIIDDRPEELKKLEQFKTTSKWKVINRDDGFNSKIQVEEIKKDVKEIEKENEIIFGKMYSDSEDEKKDLDASPPRQKDMKSNKRDGDSDISPPRKRQNDSDESPPRKQKDNRSKRDTNSDSRKRQNDSDASPPRKQKDNKSKRDTNSDSSPPRKRRNESDVSPPRKKDKNKRNSESDASPPRKHRNNSPMRSKKDKSKKTKDYDSDNSPPRRRNDSDESPPRKRQKDKNLSTKRYQDFSGSKNRDNKKTGYDSDLSPPRKNTERVKERRKPSRWGDENDRSKDKSPRNKRNKSKSPKRSNYDSDLSPPRKSRKDSPKRIEKSRNNNKQMYQQSQDSDSDLSPPRKRKSVERDRYRNSDSPPPTNKKMARTLEGKMAGLQNAVQLRQENEQFRRKEDEAFKRMTDDVSGRNAQVVSRKGKRETSEDRQKQREKAERQKELDEKYKKWSKGIKQIEAQEARVQQFVHEASKPLARHKDDKDLESHLKDIERAGDPMLQYMREKKRERGELGPEKPSYKGSFPPNRFNIRPGYRWDGVDRSNGYEKKYFETQSKRKAQEEEAYKWSTEDL